MNVFISRIAAAIAATLVVWVLGALGVDVTEQQRAEIIGQVTQAITLLGLAVWGLVYAVGHKLISRRTNPADTAKAPEQAAASIGGDFVTGKKL